MYIIELNTSIYQDAPAGEPGQIFRVVCDYYITYNMPGTANFRLQASYTDVLNISIPSGTGTLSALAAGGTFVGGGSRISLSVVGDVHIDTESGHYLRVEVDNVSLRRIA